MRPCIVMCALLMLLASVSYGQTVGASVQGTVTDATGAVLPGANITLKNSATGASLEFVSDERGRYLAPVVQPGEYEIQVSLAGFQSVARRGVRLAVGQSVVVDLKLEVGQVANQVEVIADANPINLTSSAVSGLVTSGAARSALVPFDGHHVCAPSALPARAAGTDARPVSHKIIPCCGPLLEPNLFLWEATIIMRF